MRRLLLSLGACLIVLLAHLRLSAAEFKVRLIVHTKAHQISYSDAKRVLDQVQTILCDACPKATKKKTDCALHFILVDPPVPSQQANGNIPPIGVDKNGWMSSPVMTHVAAAGVDWRKPGQDDPLTVRVVPGFLSCGLVDEPKLVDGCTVPVRADPPYREVFVLLTDELQSGRDDNWFTRQAQIWAHEFGHYVGLPDLRTPDAQKSLMYWQAGIDHLNLNRKECKAFESYDPHQH